MKYRVKIIIPRILSGEIKGKIKEVYVDDVFISKNLKVGEYFNVMGGLYKITKILDVDKT